LVPNTRIFNRPKISVHPADWNDWPKNIILPEVTQFIHNAAEEQRKDGNNFPLHKYIHHGLSSQALLFNLIGPLLIKDDLSPLKTLVEKKGLQWPGAGAKARFEYEDRSVFNEQQGQPHPLTWRSLSRTAPRIFLSKRNSLNRSLELLPVSKWPIAMAEIHQRTLICATCSYWPQILDAHAKI